MVDSYKDEFNKKEDKNDDTTNPPVFQSLFNHQSLCLLRSVALAAAVFNMAGNLTFYPIKQQQKKSLVAKF